jgi:hypothetical protein
MFPRGRQNRQLAHFFSEADRGTMVLTDMLRKFRGYYHFIKKQQQHKEAFGIHNQAAFRCLRSPKLF